MEILRDIQNEKLKDHRDRVVGFLSHDIMNKCKADIDRLNSLHVEFLGDNPDLTIEEINLIRLYTSFLKDNLT